MTILKVRNVVTKVPHKCSGCLRNFPKDTNMVYEAIVNDGTVDSVYICDSCHNVIKKKNQKVVRFYPGDFYKDAVEYEASCV